MENKLDEKLINHILESLKKDYEVWNCYREDSVKSCLYFSIRKYFLEENEKIEELESKIFVYPEVRNNDKKRFDLVISNNQFINWDDNKIYWFNEFDKDIIEIKYIKWTENQIINSLENDFKKLLEVEENNIKSKNIFFIYEYYKRDKDYVENVKKKILEIWDNENFIEKIKNSEIKINIFWLFIDLPDTELKKNLEIDFFKN